MIFDLRPNCVPVSASSSRTRQALLLTTILAAGVVVVTPAARAQSVNDTITGARTTPYYKDVVGTDNLTLTVDKPGSIDTGDSSAAVYVTSEQGNISIGGSGNLSGYGRIGAVAAITDSGTITLSGTGDISSTTSGDAVYAETGSNGSVGNITITRSGSITANNNGIRAYADTGGAINISGVGTINAGFYGIYARTTIGAINISNIGPVTSTSGSAAAIYTTGGFINIGGDNGLSNAISGGNGITASGITANIKTTTGGTVTATSGAAITAVAGSSTVSFGALKIDVGANVTGKTYGITTVSSDNRARATTSITIGAGAIVTGETGAIATKTRAGNVTVNNAGIVNGSISTALFTGSNATGTFTFNNSGTLALTGAQANTGFALNNQSGGVLTGTGSFGDVTAAAGSRIEAGIRPPTPVVGVPVTGTLNATSLTLASGAIVDVRVDYSGVSDRVNVTGAAALNGATLNVRATPKENATWVDQKTFTILTATSVTGTFANITTDYAFLKFTATYSDTGVRITSDRNWTSFGTYATNSNQKSVSDVFDKFQAQADNPVILSVRSLSTQQATNSLTQLSGTGLVATRTQAVAAKTAFTSAINTEMNRFTGSAGGGSAPLSYAPDTSIKSKAFDKIAKNPEPIIDGRIWAHVLGGFGEMRADASSGSPAERSNHYGLAAGADTAINPNLRAGFALSVGQSTTKISSLATNADATWGQGALYGVLTDGNDYLKGALTYSYIANKSDRIVSAFGTNDKASGKYGANLLALRLETGRKFAFDPVALTPFVAIEPAVLLQNAYQETGPASITLGFDKTTTRALPTTLGVKADAAYDLGSYRMTPSATIGWVHDFGSASSISPFFTALPGSNFTVQGAKGDRNLARTELALEASPKDTLATFYLNARADLGARTTSVRGMAGVSLRF